MKQTTPHNSLKRVKHYQHRTAERSRVSSERSSFHRRTDVVLFKTAAAGIFKTKKFYLINGLNSSV